MVQFRHVIVQLALAIDKQKVAGYEYKFRQFSYFCPVQVFFPKFSYCADFAGFAGYVSL